MKVLVALLVLSLPLAGRADTPRALWRSKCKGCHGMDGKARTRMGRRHHIQDLTSARFQEGVTDAQLHQVIEKGSPKDKKMKAFEGRLTEEEISALVRFIRALKPSQP
jgi:cytochrome c553